jgi:hypothetical protein
MLSLPSHQKKSIVIGIALSLMTLNVAAKKTGKLNFKKYEVGASQAITGKLLYLNDNGENTDIIIQKNNSLSYYPELVTKGLVENPEIISIPKNVQFFNKATLANTEKEVLLYLTNTHILAYYPEQKKTEELIKVDSMYHYQTDVEASFGEFVQDLNQDGLSDLLINSLTQTHIFIQNKQGGFTQQTLDVSPKVSSNNGGITFRPYDFYHLDVNSDNKKDIVFQIDDQLMAFVQNDQAAFSIKPIEITLNANLQKLSDEDEDPEQADVVINTLEDINNDGLADLVTKESVREGMMSRTNKLMIRYGFLNKGVLSFNKTPEGSANFEGEGMIEFKDVNGDGLKDYYTLSVEMGIGTMMSAMSGAIDMDLRFYMLGANGEYAKDPAYENEVEISIGSNNSGESLSEVDDFNGDGIKDLIIKTDDDEFKIYNGTKKRLFAKRGSDYEIELPKNVRTEIKDFNGDGKADILFLFGKSYDEDEKKEVGDNRLALWLSAS